MDDQTPGLIYEYLSTFYQWAVNFLNSNFSAAFFGALSAYIFSCFANSRREKLLEIRHCNAGVMACWSSANAALHLQKKFLNPMKKKFDLETKRYTDFKILADSGARGGVFEIEFDYTSLPAIHFDGAAIQRSVDNTSLDRKSLLVQDGLQRSLHQLNTLLDQYNALVFELKNTSGESTKAGICRYLGLPNGRVVDTRYSNCVTGLVGVAEDCVWFANRLGDGFHGRASELRGWRKSIGLQSFKLEAADLPSDTNYKSYL